MSETQGQTSVHVCVCLHAQQANSACTVQCIWICTHLVFLTALGGKLCYYSHFINKGTGAQRGPGSPARKRKGQDSTSGSLILVRVCALSHQTLLQTASLSREARKMKVFASSGRWNEKQKNPTLCRTRTTVGWDHTGKRTELTYGTRSSELMHNKVSPVSAPRESVSVDLKGIC